VTILFSLQRRRTDAAEGQRRCAADGRLGAAANLEGDFRSVLASVEQLIRLLGEVFI
jgi:hypothetical protein